MQGAYSIGVHCFQCGKAIEKIRLPSAYCMVCYNEPSDQSEKIAGNMEENKNGEETKDVEAVRG